jgi:CPA1 family monovalent cation:H+ antiporter
MNIIKSLFRVDAGSTCEHVPGTLPAPASATCQGCGSGFNLRMCTSCGHVGCCESQAGHARSHARAEGHPVIMSMPVGRGFTWCYEENRYVG